MTDAISPGANLDGERRYLTMLFSDLVGSTEIAARLDLEDWVALMAQYEAVAKSSVTAYAGHVAQFRGDGVLAYFGWPNGHENAAEAAVRAGLSMLRGLAAVNAAAPGAPQLLARIGVHAGPVVVNRAGDAYGDSANVAARIQAEAEPNSLFVSEVIAERTSGLFQIEDRGSRTLKGVSRPIPLFRVLAPAGGGRKARRGSLSMVTRFVGRTPELGALASLWQEARAGHGRVVVVAGEPGIGKSRLIQEFRSREAIAEESWLEAGGAQLFSNTSLFAVAELARRLLGESFRSSDLQQDLVERLLARVAACAKDQPTVLVVEDLHWLDPSTLEFVQKLCERIAGLHLLLVVTCRLGYEERLKSIPQSRLIEVAQMAPAAIREIVADIVPDAPRWGSFAEAVVERAGGVPLFAEEVAGLLSQRPAAPQDFEIPRTLSDLLAARLDGLGAARDVAHAAAVVGDDLPIDLVRAIVEPGSGFDAHMQELVEQRIVRLDHGRYVFRHALVRDAAYATLLKSRRRELHGMIAAIVTERFRGLASERPEFVARHWTSAEKPAAALAAWRLAGSTASSRGAFREAHQSFDAALGQLRLLSDSAERDEAELSVQRSLAAVLQITRGYSSSDTIFATARARELSNRDVASKRGRSQLSARWAALSSAGNYNEALVLADELLELAKESGSREKLGEAYMAQMTTRYRAGDLVRAEWFFRQGYPIFTTSGFRSTPGAIPQTFGNASRLAWILGNPVTAARRMHYAVLAAERRANPYDSAFCLYSAAIMAVLTQRPQEACKFAERSIALSDEHGFPQFATTARIALGRAYADMARADEGIPLIEAGIEGTNATGARVALTLYWTWLAETQAAAGEADAALVTLERALTLNTQELFFRPETLRVRAALLAERGRIDDAHSDLDGAISLAHTMGARCFELRARLAQHRLLPAGSSLNDLAYLVAQYRQRDATPDLENARAVLAQGAP